MTDRTGRLTAHIHPRTADRLDRFIAREGATRTDAVDRLVAAGEQVYQGVVDGCPIYVRHDGELERVRLI
jgi:hypothetical protein